MTAYYDRGDVIRLSAVFKDVDSAPANPSTVTLRVRDPGNTVTEYTAPAVINPETGEFYCDVPLTLAGRHYYRWEGTGTVTAAEEGEFEVRESKVIA